MRRWEAGSGREDRRGCSGWRKLTDLMLTCACRECAAGKLGQAEKIGVAALAGATSSLISSPAELLMIQQQRSGVIIAVPPHKLTHALYLLVPLPDLPKRCQFTFHAGTGRAVPESERSRRSYALRSKCSVLKCRLGSEMSALELLDGWKVRGLAT